MQTSKAPKIVKLDHFKNLVAVAMADGLLDDEERDFLQEKAEEFGIPPETAFEILKDSDKLQFMVPFNQAEKEDQLTDVVFMAMIDGEVHEKEYSLCVSIANKLGLSHKDVDHVINLVKKLWQSSQQ